MSPEPCARRSKPHRPAAARKTIESNDVTLKYMRNLTLPALDLQANYGARSRRHAVPTQRQRRHQHDHRHRAGGYGDAWRTLTAASIRRGTSR
jgi:hypothetical protein